MSEMKKLRHALRKVEKISADLANRALTAGPSPQRHLWIDIDNLNEGCNERGVIITVNLAEDLAEDLPPDLRDKEKFFHVAVDECRLLESKKKYKSFYVVDGAVILVRKQPERRTHILVDTKDFLDIKEIQVIL